MRLDHVLFETDGYRVVLHGEPELPATIVAFQPHSPFISTPAQPFPEYFLPEKLIRSDFPANFVSFQTSKNGWYCDAQADKAAQTLGAVLEGTRVITYGMSMGGFAAMNLAGHLNAARFLALAPQATVFHPFMGVIHDNRFAAEMDPFQPHHDHISAGEVLDRDGLIIFDSYEYFDVAHAGRAASLTRAKLINLPYTGHQVGRVLNRILPLRKILLAMTRKHMDLIGMRRQIELAMADLPEQQAALPETFALFLAQEQELGAGISGQALLNAARCLKLYRNHWQAEPGFPQARAALHRVIEVKGGSWMNHETWMPGYIAELLQDL